MVLPVLAVYDLFVLDGRKVQHLVWPFRGPATAERRTIAANVARPGPRGAGLAASACGAFGGCPSWLKGNQAEVEHCFGTPPLQ